MFDINYWAGLRQIFSNILPSSISNSMPVPPTLLDLSKLRYKVAGVEWGWQQVQVQVQSGEGEGEEDVTTTTNTNSGDTSEKKGDASEDGDKETDTDGKAAADGKGEGEPTGAEAEAGAEAGSEQTEAEIGKRKAAHDFTYTSDADAPSLQDLVDSRRELSDVAIEYDDNFTVKVGALEPFAELAHLTESVDRLFARDPEKFGTLNEKSGEFVNEFNDLTNPTPEGLQRAQELLHCCWGTHPEGGVFSVM